MKFIGTTSTDDWNPKTLFFMMSHKEYWHHDITWKEWGLSFRYVWYDGPIFQLWLGPLCIWLMA